MICGFQFHIQVFNPSGVYLCAWQWSSSVLLHLVVFLTSFIEETVDSPLYIRGSFIVNSLAIYVWAYFLALYSVPLIYVLVFIAILYSCDNYSSVIQFEIRKCDVSSFVFFFKITLAITSFFFNLFLIGG